MIRYMPMIRHLLNLIYPPACPVCRTKVEEEGPCKSCIGAIKKINPKVNQIIYNKKGVHFRRVYSACLYEGVLKDLIHLFKYNGRLSLVKAFSSMLVEFAESNIDMKKFDIVVPVPLYPVKQREREFNQASLLAGPIAKRFNVPFFEKGLQRIKKAAPQSSLKKGARLNNLKGAFKAAKPFERKKILLVDDIFTTGATVNECAKVLVSAGAGSVSVLTLARGE